MTKRRPIVEAAPRMWPLGAAISEESDPERIGFTILRKEENMKRLIVVACLAVALMAVGGWGGGARAAGADTPTSTPGTPSATPTVTPSATAMPNARPKTVKLWRASLKVMATVRQVHAEGTMMDGFGAKHAVHVTADCDSLPQASLEHINVHLLLREKDAHGVPTGVEFILIDGRMWTRIQSGSAPWSVWIELKGDGLSVALFALSFYLPQSCPQQNIGTNSSVPPHLMNLGAALVDGAPTWHLRAHGKSQGEPVVLNVNIDQTTYVWRRFAISQTAPKKKDTLIENTSYSRFNEPVVIEPPAVAPLRTQARAISQEDRLRVNPGRCNDNENQGAGNNCACWGPQPPGADEVG
jgi:hypothetical protein